MGRVAVVGPSGHGKSTSIFPSKELGIVGLNPKETFIFNVAGKELPVRGASVLYPPDIPVSKGGNYMETEDAKVIADVIDWIVDNRQDIKNIVIDDAGYLMSLELMEKAKRKDFDKWTDLAVNKMAVVNALRNANKKRKDLHITCMYHQEKADDGTMKIKTCGKMIDNNILLDGLFTVILYTEVKNDYGSKKTVYQFKTHGNGMDTCKSPIGMFDSDYIPNDLGLVIQKMNDYYNADVPALG